MGSNANRIRDKWQDYGGYNAANAEQSFFDVFVELFRDTEYEIISHPQDFRDVYVHVTLSQQVLREIFIPENEITKHGVIPDYAIKNTKTEKLSI